MTVNMHMLDLELRCVCSHRKWCHGLKMSRPLPKASEVGFFFFHSTFSCHFIFLFPDSRSDHPHLPSSQHFCPHKFRERICVFLLYKMNISLQRSDLLDFLPIFFTFFLFISSLHLFGLISTAPCNVPVPTWKVLLWGHVFEAAARPRCPWQHAIWRWTQICWWFTAKLPLKPARMGHLAVPLVAFLLTANTKLDNFKGLSVKGFWMFTRLQSYTLM